MKNLRKWHQSIDHFLADESGQDLIEYALVAALIGLAVVTSMRTLSNAVGSSFSVVGSKLSNSI